MSEHTLSSVVRAERLRRFGAFLMITKRWWLLPIVLTVIALVIIHSTTSRGPEPFLYDTP